MTRRNTPILILALWGAATLGLTLSGVPEVAAQQRTDGNAEARQRGGQAAGAGQQGQGQGQAGQPGALVLVFPTGDRATGNLMIEASAPAEVPVGTTFQYTLRASNISRNLVLEDVRIEQTAAEGFSIESSEPKADESQGDQAGTTWSIDRLEPGQSRTFNVSALSDKEGGMAGCIRAEYKPALCLATRFTKPSLQLAKEAPERVDICEPLTIRYRVTNSGSGAARGVRVTDELPEGLALAEGGGREVRLDVGELAQGQSRDVQVQVRPSKTGEYASRANATAEGDLSARSNRTTTQVVAADLAVAITGPETQYVNQPLTYQVEVTNKGEAPAAGSRLSVQVDDAARVLRVSRSAPNEAAPQQSGRSLTWDLGNIAPGQSSVVSFTAVVGDKAELRHTATAVAACARDDIGTAKAETVTAQTEILSFPALLLEMVDENDPVRIGETEVYTITVINQGTGEDHNVKVVAELPEQYSFVSAQGDTDAKADGRTITFGPIDRLGPRERATWRLQARADRPGDVRTQVRLSSDYLTTPVTETEPTRLIGAEPGAEPARTKSSDQNKDQPKGQSKDQAKEQPK